MGMPAEHRDAQTYAIIGAAMEVHREMGSGFLEAAYQEALRYEFALRRIPFAREVVLAIHYKGHQLGCTYKADFVCYGDVLVETKAVKQLTQIERAQVLNQLKATRFIKALLINFGALSLEYERIVTFPTSGGRDGIPA
jgi:GxxExxY protein